MADPGRGIDGKRRHLAKPGEGLSALHKMKSHTAGSLRDAVPLLWTPLPLACSTAISQADCRPTNIESGVEARLNVTVDALHTSTGGGGAPFLKRQCGQGADVVLLCAPRCRGAMLERHGGLVLDPVVSIRAPRCRGAMPALVLADGMSVLVSIRAPRCRGAMRSRRTC